ncbi:MAG: flagellar basal body rod protein FlgC [Myxococcota bacterium]
MSFFTSLVVSGSGLNAERIRADLAAANLANANSTRTPEGGPYRRRDPVLRTEAGETFGSTLERAVRRVAVKRIVVDPRPPRLVFDPSHPDADSKGMVAFPNVQVVEEITNLTNASRTYQANIAAITVSREMADRALRMGR